MLITQGLFFFSCALLEELNHKYYILLTNRSIDRFNRVNDKNKNYYNFILYLFFFESSIVVLCSMYFWLVINLSNYQKSRFIINIIIINVEEHINI